jgi:hypothetical protein
METTALGVSALGSVDVSSVCVRRVALQGLVRLWEMCGEYDPEWIGSILGRELGKVKAGEDVPEWPQRDEEIEFVREYASSECLLWHCRHEEDV